MSPSTSLVSSPAVGLTPTTPAYNISWMDTFSIPRLSKKVNDLLMQGKRLDPTSRREFVRVLVDEIITFCSKPLKKHTDGIAKKIVDEHAGSLSDKVGGEVIMGGFQSLAKQLKARVENLHRKNCIRDTSIETNSTTRRRKLDYGTVNSEPKDFPDQESEESLRLKQASLKGLFEQGERAWKPEDIEGLMKATYILQRKDININMPVIDLVKQWPFLFHQFGLRIHFELLMSIKIKECLEDSGKVEKLWGYLKASNVQKYKPVFKAAALDVLEEVKEMQNPRNVLPAAILSLMAHFSEHPDTLFMKADETATASEVQNLPVTPCLIFCGSSCCSARRFMLSVDNIVINDNIATFLDGFTTLFGTFFCLNIHYPQNAAATLDFIQRCFFRINPERGSKVEKVEKKKKYTLNPKVVTLFQNIADFEWLN